MRTMKKTHESAQKHKNARSSLVSHRTKKMLKTHAFDSSRSKSKSI